MWSVIIIIAVCVVCIAGTIGFSVYYVRKREFDRVTTMKAIALSAIVAGLFVASTTYVLMKDSVKKARQEAVDQGKKIVDSALKDASTIKAEAKAKKDSIDGEIRLSRERSRALQDSMKIVKQGLEVEKKRERTFRRLNDLKQTIEIQENTIAKTTEKIEDLNRNIELLKHAKLSIDNYRQIAELGLIRADIKQVLVHFDSVPDPPKDLIPPMTRFTDRILMVYTRSLTGAKFGIDLNELRVSKQKGNYVISGISAKYLGAEKQGVTEILTEYRRTGYNKDGFENTIEVKKDRKFLPYVENAKKKYKETIEESAGIEDIGSYNGAVVAQAQKYLRDILRPLCKNGEDCIEFTDKELYSSYQLMEYLKNELYANEKQWEEASTSIEETRNKIKIEKTEKDKMMEELERMPAGTVEVGTVEDGDNN